MRGKERSDGGSFLVEAIGWYGTVAIVAAYALVSFKLVGADGFVYQFLNLTGAAGIVGVSLHKKAYQPATLNIIWTVIALVALVGMAWR